MRFNGHFTSMIPAYPAAIQGGTEQPIYDAVSEAVLDQRLAPGARLTEGSLALLFGVSRTIVRMALLRLAHDHIVTLRPNHGATIARPTPDETRAVFEARRMIECAALPAAIAHAAPRQLDNMRTLVRQEDAAFRAGEVRSWIRLSGEFHRRLVALARNPVILHYTNELVTQSLLMTALYMPRGQTVCATDEHLLLIDAVAARDERRAIRLLRTHLDACEARLALDHEADHPTDLAAALRLRPRRASASR
jgi:DNA-binding GntR family transcriptional regulator